jgi:hypothetical protein
MKGISYDGEDGILLQSEGDKHVRVRVKMASACTIFRGRNIHKLSIWVNYNISLTWILQPFGDDFPYTNHDFQASGEQWGRYNFRDLPDGPVTGRFFHGNTWAILPNQNRSLKYDWHICLSYYYCLKISKNYSIRYHIIIIMMNIIIVVIIIIIIIVALWLFNVTMGHHNF